MGIYQSTDASTSEFDHMYIKEYSPCHITNESPRARWHKTFVDDQPEYRKSFAAGTHTIHPFALHSLIELKALHLMVSGSSESGIHVVLCKRAPHMTLGTTPPITRTFQLELGERTLDLMSVRSLFVGYRDNYCDLELTLSHPMELYARAKSLPAVDSLEEDCASR